MPALFSCCGADSLGKLSQYHTTLVLQSLKCMPQQYDKQPLIQLSTSCTSHHQNDTFTPTSPTHALLRLLRYAANYDLLD